LGDAGLWLILHATPKSQARGITGQVGAQNPADWAVGAWLGADFTAMGFSAVMQRLDVCWPPRRCAPAWSRRLRMGLPW